MAHLPERTPVWWVRSAPDARLTADAADPVVTCTGFAGSARADGTVVDVGDLPPGPVTGEVAARVRVRSGSGQVLRLEVLVPQVQAAPGMVYVEHVDRDASPVTVELIAFGPADVAARATTVGTEVAVGTVLTPRDAARLGITSADQVGAVRWVPGTGRVVEVYVAPLHRRRRIGTTLLFAAEAVTVGRGWPRLSGGSARTALGEAVLSRLRWGVGRVAPLTEVAPPMTPAADAVGVPQRNLVPD